MMANILRYGCGSEKTDEVQLGGSSSNGPSSPRIQQQHRDAFHLVDEMADSNSSGRTSSEFNGGRKSNTKRVNFNKKTLGRWVGHIPTPLHLNTGLHWEQPRFNLGSHNSSLMAVYQILDNETGSLPRMIFIVNNAKFAQHAAMVPGQLSCFSLAHGYRADFSSTDATRLTPVHRTSLSFRWARARGRIVRFRWDLSSKLLLPKY
jgi:hypothetical protein